VGLVWVLNSSLRADSNSWQLSQPITSSIIRLDHEISSESFSVYAFNGLIAINYDMKFFSEIKTLYSSPKSQIITPQNLLLNLPRYIAVKNNSNRRNNNTWIVKVFEWIPPSLIGNMTLIGNEFAIGN